MTGFLIDALAVYRIQRVVTTDSIGEPIRRGAARVGSWPGELASCPWCLSVWVAAALPILPRRLRRAAALSAVAGLIAHVVEH